jgi:hypothetical protein
MGRSCSFHIHHHLHDEGVNYCLWWWSLCREGLQCLRCLEALSSWIDFYVASSGVRSSCAHVKGAQGVMMIGGYVYSPRGPVVEFFIWVFMIPSQLIGKDLPNDLRCRLGWSLWLLRVSIGVDTCFSTCLEGGCIFIVKMIGAGVLCGVGDLLTAVLANIIVGVVLWFWYLFSS